MMQVLEAPESYAGQDERRYSTREIVEKYLDRKLPSAREGKKLEDKKRCILADWPDEVVLSRMKNRRADRQVDRAAALGAVRHEPLHPRKTGDDLSAADGSQARRTQLYTGSHPHGAAL
ncbi:MAG: hypothetical protein ACI4MF_13205 [Candidatus Faecivicinus sp.]